MILGQFVQSQHGVANGTDCQNDSLDAQSSAAVKRKRQDKEVEHHAFAAMRGGEWWNGRRQDA